MPVYELDPYHMAFPPAQKASRDGLLAVGGQLREDWLILAYRSGIFPWFNDGDPVLWWSPDPRFVLPIENLKVPRSLKPFLKRPEYEFRLDTAFDEVIDACAAIPRHGQNGTWITTHMSAAYKNLHKMGLAHSAEIWLEGRLIAGLYGVSMGSAFFGESMFTIEPNASKIAFVKLCHWLRDKDFQWIDCQVYTQHLERFGAEFVPRKSFLSMLEWALQTPNKTGKWRVE